MRSSAFPSGGGASRARTPRDSSALAEVYTPWPRREQVPLPRWAPCRPGCRAPWCFGTGPRPLSVVGETRRTDELLLPRHRSRARTRVRGGRAAARTCLQPARRERTTVNDLKDLLELALIRRAAATRAYDPAADPCPAAPADCVGSASGWRPGQRDRGACSARFGCRWRFRGSGPTATPQPRPGVEPSAADPLSGGP